MMSDKYYQYWYVYGKGHATEVIKKQPFFKPQRGNNLPVDLTVNDGRVCVTYPKALP